MKLNKNGNFYPIFAKQQDYNAEMRTCVETVVDRLLSTETTDDRPGMLLGKIQSGKTRAFMGSIALAFDNGVDVAVIFTKGTLLLAEQTLTRINNDYATFINANEMVAQDIRSLKDELTHFERNMKRVIVCMKEDDNVKKLITFLTVTNPKLSKKSILIVDDEADAASIGFSMLDDNVKMNKVPKLIDDLRSELETAHFLQVTATPYSLYLQPKEIKISGLKLKPMKPAFSVRVPVHERYIGSDFYFAYEPDKPCIASQLFIPVPEDEFTILSKKDRRRVDVDDLLNCKGVEKLVDAIVNFVVAVAYRRLQLNKNQYFSMLIHADASKNSHEWQVRLVEGIRQELMDGLAKDSPRVLTLLKDGCRQMIASGKIAKAETQLDSPEETALYAECCRAISEEWVSVIKVNSEKQMREVCNPKTGELILKTPCTIFVGGQILDRGLTIGNILSFFYGRRPKKFQQSTVMQHSRMYGPRPKSDLAVTRFYTTNRVHQAMKQMHERDSALWEHVGDSENEVNFVFADDNKNIAPCSANQIILSNTTTVKPGKRLLPFGFQIDANCRLKDHTKNIDEILAEVGITSPDLSKKSSVDQANKALPVRVKLSLALQILKAMEKSMLWEDEDNRDLGFDWQGTAAILRYYAELKHLKEEDRKAPGYVDLVVRWGRELNRNVSESSHVRFNNAPYSYNETAVYETASSSYPMLDVIQQLGDKAPDKEVADSWNGGPFWWPVLWCPKDSKYMIYGHEGSDGEG
jgi:hypothetical protein